MQRLATRVWIGNREYRVAADSTVKAKANGGAYRPLPNQSGALAVKARKMASGELFCEHAMTDLHPNFH